MGVLIFLFTKKSKNVESSFSGCDGLKGDECISDMFNHLSSEHEMSEIEIRNVLVELINNNSNDCTKNVIDIWDRELKHHFQEEENVVFPKILEKDSSLKPLIDYLLDEHKFFYSEIAEMKRLGNCKNITKVFCEKLLKHINKEEVLFRNIK